ncbi:DUF397 domain-containing protein [Streptomyces sp. NPDC057253]|uniref:DUF397 domain-containing protein n=1 Tax=Streptomyces sp. NPDC057253 TaxID=3346069 RepID=UPI00364503BF
MQPWVRSSFCGGGADACVEVRWIGSSVYVRDSKHAPGDSENTKMRLTTRAWLHFIVDLSSGEPVPT